MGAKVQNILKTPTLFRNFLYLCPKITSHLKQRNYEKGVIFIVNDGNGYYS
jgi:hypothetical protein